jgi:hypothetical protein
MFVVAGLIPKKGQVGAQMPQISEFKAVAPARGERPDWWKHLEFVGPAAKWIADGVWANAGTITNTLAGSFFGAYFAFLLAGRRRKAEIEEKNVGAINRALYTIFEMWNVLRQYQREQLDEWRGRPDAWLNLTATPLGQAPITFEAGELSFLLETDQPNTMATVLLQERRLKLALGLIDQRSTLVLNSVFPRMAAAGVPVGANLPEPDIERIVGIDVVHKLRQYTDHIYRFVDTDVPDLEAAFRELRALAKRLYPKRKIIDVAFQLPDGAA